MQSRIIAVLVAFILLVANAPAASGGGRVTSTYGFPDDPGIPTVAE